MNKQILILIPLIFMFTISMFSLAGLESSEGLGTGYKYGNLPEEYLYDYTGLPIIYTANFTTVNGNYIAVNPFANVERWGTGEAFAFFTNATTFSTDTGWYLFTTSVGNSTGLLPLPYNDFVNYKQNALQNSFLDITASFSTSYGLIALFISLMVGVGLAGIHFLGIGESETSLKTIFMGVGFIAVWSVFSVISLNLLADIPYGLGAIFYFGLTLSYVAGLMMNIGN